MDDKRLYLPRSLEILSADFIPNVEVYAAEVRPGAIGQSVIHKNPLTDSKLSSFLIFYFPCDFPMQREYV